MITSGNISSQFGDTTYTKVFVGGLAWETQRETMKKYFEQFGEILEAVVITDKNTGRSKGYGFVTFREPEAAMRACVDAAPVIDGRRANCNLASLGVQRSRPSTPKHGGSRFRIMNSFQTGGIQGGGAAAFASATTYPHYAIQQGIPYNVYGYSPYSTDYSYHTSYYNMYGGAGGPMYGGAAGMVAGAAFYPYYHYGQGSGAGYPAAQGYGMQYPQIVQYSAAINTAGVAAFPQHYGGPLSLAGATPAAQSGLTMALPSPALPAQMPQHYGLHSVLQTHFTPAPASEQPSA